MENIPYITLWAVKFDECLKFYKDLIGLKTSFEDKNFAQFKFKGTKLYLHRIKGETETLREHSVEIHFSVDDVDQKYEELKDKGVVFDQEPVDAPWGNRYASFKDPEGFSIEIVGPLKRS